MVHKSINTLDIVFFKKSNQEMQFWEIRAQSQT